MTDDKHQDQEAGKSSAESDSSATAGKFSADDILFGQQPRSEQSWRMPITEADGGIVYCNTGRLDKESEIGGRVFPAGIYDFYTTSPVAASYRL